ncbi:hypothetical protein [Aminobacter sp. MET-1]|uniref:hypothetical protein n=1 Tax=Aminobacter sp. MET-1 TaxID=2951085 RepID=UPI00226A98E0|nr:hypothetical protein [Aminobacter sp. MET-1]MCX8570594.1 hypothetical protein [Aminobacter sp. MET-1]
MVNNRFDRGPKLDASATQPQADIVVFVIEEDMFIEPADTGKMVAANEDASAMQDGNLAIGNWRRPAPRSPPWETASTSDESVDALHYKRKD